ncbi:hypothetical protein KBI51_06885 [Aerococcaceae bacterium zg-ZUI334]|uniref:hypothetical protein n=1 Tax=Aerococcaceae TaxID=186827 RepID=UPI0013BA3DA0|nr:MULTISPECIES: hypothetical protein [unclassified Facklamia]MBR7927899.1 hypothetical protein [Aerococcaceae bacterium zg-ZUI334]MBS4462365.1 hypothetical protein [Aerococcaceae bacterium zg-B36]QQD66044.1 hypothetical protein JDW14_02665 [Aerococcaceae bacterium zg-252]NEW64877.1 hypothetical protein [Facklamia sp. 252]NEW68199.1 hypothetical protein [Facklamia sp. 253]
MRFLTNYLVLLSIITSTNCGVYNYTPDSDNNSGTIPYNSNRVREDVEQVKRASDNSILSVMFDYQRAHDELFWKTSPVDSDIYGSWSGVPGFLLSNAFYKGKQVAFHWYSYTVGEGEPFELIECFVNSKATEIIIFATKDSKKYVFHSSNPSTSIECSFNLEESKDEILNRFIK